MLLQNKQGKKIFLKFSSSSIYSVVFLIIVICNKVYGKTVKPQFLNCQFFKIIHVYII